MNKKQAEMDERNTRVLICGGIMLLLFIAKQIFFPGYFPEPEEQVWRIGSAPAVSGRYGQCDATDDCLYFSHWGTDSQVDVYSHDGAFLYALGFRDASNGRIYIRCEHDLLYIKLRNNNVFIFEGQALRAGFSEKEADAKGLTNEWFDDGMSRLVAENGMLLFLDESGQVLGPVTVPSGISLSHDFVGFGPETNGLIVGTCAMIVFSFCLFHIFKKRK